MLKKVICIIVSIVFLSSNISFALSPQPGSNDPSTKSGMYAAGQKLWANKKSPGFIDSIIETPKRFIGRLPEELPSGVKFIMPKDDEVPEGWEKNPLLFSTDLIEALKYFRDKEAVLSEDIVEIKEGYFDVREEDGELPIARLEKSRDGKYTLIVHTKFAQMWNHIVENDIWFEYTFEDGEKRVVSLAWGILIRLAKHEMLDVRKPGYKKTPEDETDKYKSRGHIGFKDGEIKIHENEFQANRMMGRYSLPNNAIWLWFLSSYCFTNKVRYNNKVLSDRINWIFNSKEALGLGLLYEFPDIAASYNLQEARDIALAINYHFFSRKNRNSSTLMSVPELSVEEEMIQEYQKRTEKILKSLQATGRSDHRLTIQEVMEKIAVSYQLPKKAYKKLLPEIEKYLKDLEKENSEKEFQQILILADKDFEAFIQSRLSKAKRAYEEAKRKEKPFMGPEARKKLTKQEAKRMNERTARYYVVSSTYRILVFIWDYILYLTGKSSIMPDSTDLTYKSLGYGDEIYEGLEDGAEDFITGDLSTFRATPPADITPSKTFDEFIKEKEEAEKKDNKTKKRDLLSTFSAKLGLDKGPGGQEPIAEEKLSRIWEAVSLMQEKKIEIFIPRTIILADSVKKALRKLKSRNIDVSVTRYKAEELVNHLPKSSEETTRIVLTTRTINKDLDYWIKKRYMSAMYFRNVRILTIDVPKRFSSLEDEVLFQSRLLMMAILARLAGEETSAEAEARNLLWEMLDGSFMGLNVNLFEFMRNLTGDTEERIVISASLVKERLSYFLEKELTIDLVKKLETEIRILQEFWTYA